MHNTRRRFLAAGAGAAWGALSATSLHAAAPSPDSDGTPGKTLQLHPIGKVEKEGKVTRLHVHEPYAKALKGLGGFSHVWVFWWFDRNDKPERRRVLQVHPRGNRKNPLTGVFACRSPVRPNLIALTLCNIRSVSDDAVEVERIDAFAGTPILDLKPYIPGCDAPKNAPNLPGWLTGKKPAAPPAR